MQFAVAMAEGDPRFHDDEEDGEEAAGWDDWNDDDECQQCVCLFCDGRWNSGDAVFEHCAAEHAFDFGSLRKSLGLDFYASFKLINYVRSQVAANRCWSCGLVQESNVALLNHLKASKHSSFIQDSYDVRDGTFSWQDDRYLTPFLQDDSLLYSFEEDGEDTVDGIGIIDKEELIQELGGDCLENIKDLVDSSSDDDDISGLEPNNLGIPRPANGSISPGRDLVTWEIARTNKRSGELGLHGGIDNANGVVTTKKKDTTLSSLTEKKDKMCKVTFANVAKKEIKNINESYFGSYSRFGIHREMLSDQVRMDAYRGAILNNPSLFKEAVVMDVGCGTGILSLFAAQAGASKVIAVEASEKMASVACQVAKANKMLREEGGNRDGKNSDGVITVVEGMIEELDNFMPTEYHSVDVIVSEWMGYCLLYESMLSSVIYARDRWLKPGGAILPDTAEMFVAGVGKGGTSLSFWENVYGFDMSCIGKEVVEDAAQLPIIDIVDSKDIVTGTCTLHVFDLMTLKLEEMDFTTTFELQLISERQNGLCGQKQKGLEGECREPICNDFKDLSISNIVWCHGLVLWFETAFTSRFCKEMPTVLSTSPYKTKTHWSQTLLTFREPIALSSCSFAKKRITVQSIGTEASPASCIKGRISIARSFRHRSIDISVETMAVGIDEQVRLWYMGFIHFISGHWIDSTDIGSFLHLLLNGPTSAHNSDNFRVQLQWTSNVLIFMKLPSEDLNHITTAE